MVVVYGLEDVLKIFTLYDFLKIWGFILNVDDDYW